MKDSLNQTVQAFSGIPDAGTRAVLLVVSVFVLAVTLVLVYFRMRENEEASG